jgi:hypothetical protein
LLACPNHIDPLNGDAVAMYLHWQEEYKQKIKEYIQKYTREEALKEQEEGTVTVHWRVLCLTFQKTKPMTWSCSRKSTCFSERLLFPSHEKQIIIFIFKQSNFFYY